MSKEYQIDLRDFETLLRFLDEVESIASEIVAISGKVEINAKSFVALLSLASLQPIIVRIIGADEKDLNTFNDICKEYIVS